MTAAGFWPMLADSTTKIWWRDHLQWDAVWHLSIALDGYGLNPKTYAFPPGFGWLLRLVTDAEIQFRTLWSGQSLLELSRDPNFDPREIALRLAAAINLMAFYSGNTLATRLISERFQIHPSRVLAACLANPFAYFAMTAYADPLYHLLFWLSLTLWLLRSPRAEQWGFRPWVSYSARAQWLSRWGLSLILFVAPWVRLNAYALLGLAAGSQLRTRWMGRFSTRSSETTQGDGPAPNHAQPKAQVKDQAKSGLNSDLSSDLNFEPNSEPSYSPLPVELTALFISAVGFILFNWIKTDRPFFFLLAQRVYGMPEGNFFDGFARAVGMFYEGLSGDAWISTEIFLHWFSFGVLPLVFLLALLALAIQLYRHRELGLAAVVLLHVLITHNQAIWRSTPRYAFPLVAMALLLLIMTQSSPWRRVVFALGLGLGWVMQVSYYATFRVGGWGF